MSSERYGGDSESEDDNFNPAPADASDEEDNHDRTSPQVKHDVDAPSSPAQQDHDDDNDEEEDARPSNAGSRKASKAPANLTRDADGEDEDEEEEDAGVKDDDDEEEDEDEEDEEDEDDVHEGHRRKRSRKDRRAAFFDIEAEVDDEDEAEDDEKDDEEIENFIDNAHPDDMIESGRLDDDRRHRELDRRREMERSLDAEKLAESLRQRYGNRRPTKGFGDSAVVPKRLLLPSVEDPSIWGVRCKEGKEREVVFSIMKRVEERYGTAQQLGITAAFERGGLESAMKGYVYVEALRQNDVMLALDGMLNVYPRTKMVLVEIKEMPSLLHITKTASLNPGDWVRLRRPAKHAGDLAQVLDVTENGLEARVRFIPRIDYSIPEKGADGKRKRPGTVRPPQRLFNEAEARKRGSRQIIGNSQSNAWTYNGDDFENGFQVKDIKIQNLQLKDVVPGLEEVARFATEGEDGTESLDLKALASSLKSSNKNVTYLSGDVIEVYEGEQKGVVGKAINVQGDIVTLQVTEGELAGNTIDVPNKGLRKRFKTGDHVKVIGGSRYRDEVGMVVKIAEDRVTLLTDQTNTEVTVFSKDLREADDIGGQGSLGQYSLLDLVQLDATTVGCIVKVDRESLVVLDQNGDARQIMPSQITNVLPKRKTAVAADRNGSEIRLDDVVREHGGQQRQGKIIHIHRSFVYLHSNASNENAGVFVTRASNVATVAAKGGRINAPSGPDLNSMNPSMMRNPKANGQMNPPKVFGRDKALGQTVTIRKGGYKGLLGIVKDATDTHARVELHTKSKIVNVPKADLIFKDKNTGRVIDINMRGGFGGGRGGGSAGSGGRGGGYGGGSGGSSGWDGSRTPAAAGGFGSRTPAWGASKPAATAYTPAWNRNPDTSGSRTPAPAWKDGSRTVNPYDGNRTAYGGATAYGGSTWGTGSKTPAPDSYGLGSRTPAIPGGHGGSNDAWGSGSKTPAPYGVSAPTPGASGNDAWGYTPGPSGASDPYGAPTPGAGLSAPTPAALNAPTPGGYPSAPTPAPISAPTPGAGWAGGWGADPAPTPAAGAPTPGATGGYYGAPTPAAYGAPETPAAGPRYEDDD